MDLSIVIVTHNSSSPVEKCLDSLQKHPPSFEYEIVVIDNASTDGTPRLIEEHHSSVRLIENQDNRGYSKGVNQGFRESTGKYVLVLNPDIIVREDSIDALVRFMDSNPEAAIAGSKLVFPDGSVQPSCRSFYTLKALFLRRTFLGKIFPGARALREHLLSDYDHEQARQVDWIIGACMIVRREAAESVGLMDERFFLYFEDTDWCYRMGQHGKEVWYVPESVMVHLYERSSANSMLSRPFLIHMLSLLRYYEKWNAIFYFFRRHRGSIKSILFVISDLIAINLSFLAAYYLRDFLQPMFTKDLYPISWYSIFIVFYNFLFLLTFVSTGLYRIRRGTDLSEEFSEVFRAVLIIFAVLLTASYLTKVRIFSRAVILGHAFLTVLTVTLSRRLIRQVHSFLVSASFDLRRVLLAGEAAEALEFESMLSGRLDAGLDVIGRIGPGEGALGGLDDLPSIVRRFRVQELIIFPSVSSKDDVVRIMTKPVARTIRINIVSPAARVTGRDARSEHIDGFYMFALERGASFLLTRTILRVLDVLAGALLLPLSVAVWIPFRIVYGIAGGVRFTTESRKNHRGEFGWPRAVLRSGREASDLLKPRLFVHLMTGRLALLGPPARPAGPGAKEQVGRPGLSGSWRVEPSVDMESAIEDEILMSSSRSFFGEIVLMARSVIPCLAGRYPDWYHNRG